MSLIDDYLGAVALLLPEGQRDDITAELRDVILSRLEAREAELGRPASEAETEAVLRDVGHPVVVAARYRGGPQQVVGPELYPYWAFAVKVAVTIQCVVAGVVFVVRALGGGNLARAFDQALASALTGAATLVGIATLVAWLIERQGLRIGYLDRWRVRDLRGLRFVAWNRSLWDADAWRKRMAGMGSPAAWSRAATAETPGARAGRALGAIAAGTVLVLWWVDILPIALVTDASDLRVLGVEPGRLAAIDWQSLKAALFWPVLAYGAAIIAQGVLLMARPRAVRLHGVFDLAIAGLLLAAAAWVWSASPLGPLVRVDSAAQFAARLKFGLGHAPIDPAPLFTLAIVVTVFGAVLRALRGAWELLGGPDAWTLPGVAPSRQR